MNPSSLVPYACTLMEPFTDCSTSMVSLWTAVMVGILIGWIWKPRWVSSVLVSLKIKPCDLWSSPFEIQRLWPTLNPVVTSPKTKTRSANCSSMLSISPIEIRYDTRLCQCACHPLLSYACCCIFLVFFVCFILGSFIA